MDYRKFTLIILSILTLIFLSVGFSFSVTKNSSNVEKMQNTSIEITTYSIKIGSEVPKYKNE